MYCILDLEKLKSKGARFLVTHLEPNTDDCINYPYAKDTHGYGLVGGFGKGVSKAAHRLMYECVYMESVPVVLHSCDNPSCVNPLHLRGGTKADNNKDRAIKGRSAKVVPSRQRLTQDNILFIRANWLPAKGRPKNYQYGTLALARLFRVDPAVICKVIKGTYLCPS